jgi:acetone carboxylase gamma subunit
MKDEDKRLKMAIIAGASHAIKFKEKNWRATEDEVVRHVSENVREILEKIDNPL